MKPAFFLCCIAFLGLPAIRARAQVIVTGRTLDKDNGGILYPATVRNKRSGAVNLSDIGGNYRIPAAKGDEILFTYVGYRPDSIRISAGSGTVVKDIYLSAKPLPLAGVEVSAGLTPYQLDSINRRKLFGDYLNKPRYNIFGQRNGSATGGYTPQGFGLSISPFTFFSRDQRRKRKFARLYAEEERQAFIDSRYTPGLVSKITGLKGDSLALFMNSHQPGYEFIRAASDWELMYWISYTCKRYREGRKDRR